MVYSYQMNALSSVNYSYQSYNGNLIDSIENTAYTFSHINILTAVKVDKNEHLLFIPLKMHFINLPKYVGVLIKCLIFLFSQWMLWLSFEMVPLLVIDLF